jgi:2-haloacid dehalogenase
VKLADFKALSFDCYGTLIDWETGLLTALRPLLDRASAPIAPDLVLAAFAEHEFRQQAATPSLKYADLLAMVHAQLAALWNVGATETEHRRFGASVGDWPAFPDTVEALRTLKRRFRLVILSNVDREGFRATNQRLGVAFDAVFTVQDIGSYKPDPRNFVYLRERMAEAGIATDRLLHVAQSLFHDHAPANAAGLASAWIDRRHAVGGSGATVPPPAGVRYDFRFTSLGELARAVEAERR